MNKKQAIKLFGSVAHTARALGVTSSAISQWPDDLPQIQVDRVVGAAIRNGIDVSECRLAAKHRTNKNASAVVNG